MKIRLCNFEPSVSMAAISSAVRSGTSGVLNVSTMRSGFDVVLIELDRE